MEKVYILANLEDLVDRLDARTRVMIYEGVNNPVFNGLVYELLCDDNAKMKAYGRRAVKGLTITCGFVNILIEEA